MDLRGETEHLLSKLSRVTQEREDLERAIAEFDSNPLSVRLIRRMATELPDLFIVAALKYLDSPEESGAHQILTSLMLRHHSVFDEVADPSRGSQRRSVTLFSRLVKVDLSFDVKLARKLPDRSGSNHAEAFDGPRSCRVLDVFDEISVRAPFITNPGPPCRQPRSANRREGHSLHRKAHAKR